MKLFPSILLVAFCLFSITPTQAQKKNKAPKDWSTVDFFDLYKGNVKIGGGAAKALKKYPLFVNSFTLSQATAMKGKDTKGDQGMFAAISISGLKEADFQNLTNELYVQLVSSINAAGMKHTDGVDVLASDFAQKQLRKKKDNQSIGNIGSNTSYENKNNLFEGFIPGYPVIYVKRDINFRPENSNVYVTGSQIPGRFYLNLAAKEKFNLLSIRYTVSYASFDASRGYSTMSMEAKASMAVSVQVVLTTPNESINFVELKKIPIYGNGGWANGVEKVSDNKSLSESTGLAFSAGFEVKANSEAYIAELKAILTHLQQDIVDAIAAKLK